MNGSILIGVCSIAFGLALTVGFSEQDNAPTPKSPSPAQSAAYPYESEQFTKFVDTSYRVKGSGSSNDFYTWFDAGFGQITSHKPAEYLDVEKQTFADIKDLDQRAEAEQGLCGTIHGIVKKVIPKFSLEHGFEFYQAKDLGERQCFLQSVLVCGLLQRAGVDSGVVMVYKNIAGQATNNGHAVAVARLSNGKDVLVDCSDPSPFVEHKGLFMRDGESDYIYVNPQYEGGTGVISSYRQEGLTTDIAPRSLSTLDLPFIYSQFDYYRGERAPGGFFETPITPDGLAQSALYLQKSIREDPRNPLAVYMLGHIYVKQGRTDAGMSQYLAAKDLYERYGWVPQGVKDALAH